MSDTVEVAPGIQAIPINPTLEARWRLTPEAFRAAKLVLVGLDDYSAAFEAFAYVAFQRSVELIPIYRLPHPILQGEADGYAQRLGLSGVERYDRKMVEDDVAAWTRRVSEGTDATALSAAQAWDLPRLADALGGYSFGVGAALPESFKGGRV